MSGIATAIAGTAVLGYIGSEKAAEAGATASKDSAAVQAQIAQQNIDFQKWLWGEQKGLTMPWVTAGESALGQYQQDIGKPFTAADMEADPGYQFRLSEGTKAIESSAAAKGMQLSGGTLKDLGRFSQGLAAQEFSQAYLRRQDYLNRLDKLAQLGLGGATQQAIQGGYMGSNVSGTLNRQATGTASAISDLGNIQAASAMAPANLASDLTSSFLLYKGMSS